MTHHRWLLLAAVFAMGTLLASDAFARGRQSTCKQIASVQLAACTAESVDDYLSEKANCLNEEDFAERRECEAEARAESREAGQLCREQLVARKDLCDALAENRYEPDFEPADYESDFSNLQRTNDYFPLGIGNTWEYEGEDETIAIEVLPKTKLIEGVTCVTVRDVVTEDGQEVEDTDDWFAQKSDGSVAYCGEISMNFELYPGDDPLEAELVDVEGSWKAGRDGALAGFVFLGAPEVGDVYRQELARGDAEDAAEVLSTTYSFGSDPELDEFVPAELAQTLCANGDCIVTGEFTPVDPGVFERKYYARGVGLFLEVNPEDGEVVELTDCNFAPVCEELD